MSIEGQGHFFTIYFQALYVLCLTRPIYQVSVYRTIGPLVILLTVRRLHFSLWFSVLLVLVSVTVPFLCVSDLSLGS